VYLAGEGAELLRGIGRILRYYFGDEMNMALGLLGVVGRGMGK
jgi:hypothetical protein